MIIDTEEHVLTISLARQMLAALIHFPSINERTEIKFSHYKGSGWTVSVIKNDEETPEPSTGTFGPTPQTIFPIHPGITYTNDQFPLGPKLPFTVYAETK